MDAPLLGRTIEPTEVVKRDAIHVAVAPAVAAQTLFPGQHVGAVEGGRFGESAEPVGVVDPFLTCMIREGTRFWLFLYPQTVTRMRHHWSHPAFADSDEAS